MTNGVATKRFLGQLGGDPSNVKNTRSRTNTCRNMHMSIDSHATNLHTFSIKTNKFTAGGEASTRLPPEGLVEQFGQSLQHKRRQRKVTLKSTKCWKITREHLLHVLLPNNNTDFGVIGRCVGR